MNGNQPVGAPDPNDPLANPVPAQRIPDPTPEDFLNWVHERMQEQPPARVAPPRITGGQMWDLQHSSGPVQQLMMNKILMSDPANRDYMTRQAAYEEHQKQLGQIMPVIGAGVRGQAMRDVAGMRDEATLQRQGWVKVQDINGEWTWIRNPNVPAGTATPQTSGQPPIGMATPSPTPEPSMKVQPSTPSNVSSNPGASLNVLRSGVRGLLKTPGAPKTLMGPQGPMQWSITKQAWEPALDTSGAPIGSPSGSTYADTAARIDEARTQANIMKTHYDAAVARGRGLGGFAASPLARHEATSWMSGYMGQGGKDAQLHETYRGSLAVTLAPLLSGSKRAVTGIMQAIRPILPAFTDEPTVAAEKYRNLNMLIDLAGSLPGSTPEQRAHARSVLRSKIMAFATDPQQQAELMRSFSESDAQLDPGETLSEGQSAPRPSSGNPILDEAMRRADEKRRQRTGAP